MLPYQFDGTTGTLYVDGTLNATASPNSQPDTTLSRGLRVGADPDNIYYPASPAAITQIRISSVIRYSSNFTPATSFTTDSDTIVYHKFSEGTGSTVHDETNNHDLTLEGNPEPIWEER